MQNFRFGENFKIIIVSLGMFFIFLFGKKWVNSSDCQRLRNIEMHPTLPTDNIMKILSEQGIFLCIYMKILFSFYI